MLWMDKIRKRFHSSKKVDYHANTAAYPERLSRLTTSEYKIFMLLREGFTKKECSQRLQMKRRDVKKYTKCIFRKLGVKSLTELIVQYREER